MTGKGALDYLKGICERFDEQAKMSLKRAAVVAALPVAASFTVACYAAPDSEPFFEDTDTTCSDGIDNDEDSLIDCADSSCNGFADCGAEVCDDDFDNDADGDTDCDDADCSGDAACQ
jgi:hypothetical protein